MNIQILATPIPLTSSSITKSIPQITLPRGKTNSILEQKSHKVVSRKSSTVSNYSIQNPAATQTSIPENCKTFFDRFLLKSNNQSTSAGFFFTLPDHHKNQTQFQFEELESVFWIFSLLKVLNLSLHKSILRKLLRNESTSRLIQMTSFFLQLFDFFENENEENFTENLFLLLNEILDVLKQKVSHDEDEQNLNGLIAIIDEFLAKNFLKIQISESLKMIEVFSSKKTQVFKTESIAF